MCKVLLFLVLLAQGQSLVTKLAGREYHLIEQKKSWTEARDYCRSKYTDLTSILSSEQGKAIAPLSKLGTWLWIGLYNDKQASDGWKWITGEQFNYTNWAPWCPQQFNTISSVCVYISKDQWLDVQCGVRLGFICYTELPRPSNITEPEVSMGRPANVSEIGEIKARSLQSPISRIPSSADQSQVTKLAGREYHLIEQKKSWTEARDYCRSKYTDLTSILSSEEGKAIAPLSKLGTWLWIGLYNDKQASDGWKWITGEQFNYTNWAPWCSQQFNTISSVCVYISKDQWLDAQCGVKLPFICYTEQPRPSNATKPEVSTAQPANVLETGAVKARSLQPSASRTPSSMGLPSTAGSEEREYYLINQDKTWTDARDYCWSDYTDLVSIRDPKEQQIFRSLLGQAVWKWIGLYNEELSSDGWKWANGDTFTYANWALAYPGQFKSTSPVCVCTDGDEWFDIQGDFPLPFICYEDAQRPSISSDLPVNQDSLSGSGDTQVRSSHHFISPTYTYSDYIQSIGTADRMYFLIDWNKGWFEARDYCQLYYSDLLSIRNTEEAGIVAPLVNEMKWIGLSSDGAGGWKWTNGDKYQYSNWSPSDISTHATGVPVCVKAASDGWRKGKCNTLAPFICYLDLQRPPRILPEELNSPFEISEHKDVAMQGTITARNFKSNRSQSVSGTDRMYYLMDEEKTWNRAWNYCRTHYTNLASVRSAEEANIFGRLLHGPQWIGLYTDGVSGWVWTNGDRLSYTKWALWHPYSYNSSLPMCVAMFDSEWHEADCDFPFAFVCYRELKERYSSSHSSEPQPPKSGLPANSEFSLRTSNVDVSPRRSYHVVELEKTWPDARDYCLVHHTDLLSIRDKQENVAVSALFRQIKLGWCGLYNDQQNSDGWKWANGDDVGYTSWKVGNPYRFVIISPVCVYVEDGQWSDAPCRFLFPFVCYSDEPQETIQPTARQFDFSEQPVLNELGESLLLPGETNIWDVAPEYPTSYQRVYFLINIDKTWNDAQMYCRTQHKDLLSIRDQEENDRTARLLKHDAQSWIGLFNEHQSDYGWQWSNGDRVTFLNWDNFYPMDFTTMSVCVIQFNGRWKDVPCDFAFPFICYAD